MRTVRPSAFGSRPGLSFTWRMRFPVPSRRRERRHRAQVISNLAAVIRAWGSTPDPVLSESKRLEVRGAQRTLSFMVQVELVELRRRHAGASEHRMYLASMM